MWHSRVSATLSRVAAPLRYRTGFVAAVVVVAAGAASAGAGGPHERAAAFRKARTVETPADLKKGDVALPVYRYLKAIGLSPVPAGANGDVRFTVTRSQYSRGAQYSGGYLYTGAEVHVSFTLRWGGHELQRSFQGSVDPPKTIFAYRGEYRSPEHAPFSTALYNSGYRREVLGLLRDLRGVSPDVHQAAVAVANGNSSECSKLGAAAVGPLISVLDDPDRWVRADAARHLGKLKDPRVVPALAAAAARELDPLDLAFVCRALLDTGEPSADEMLLKLLRDGAVDRRRRVAEVLAGSGRAVLVAAAIRYALKDDNPGSDEWRAYLANDLERSGPQAAAPLRAALQDPDPEVRSLAVEWIHVLKGPESRNTAAALLKDPAPGVRGAAVRFFNGDLSPEVDRLLAPMLKDSDPAVRGAALEALVRWGWMPRTAEEHSAANAVWSELPQNQSQPAPAPPWGPPPTFGPEDQPWGAPESEALPPGGAEDLPGGPSSPSVSEDQPWATPTPRTPAWREEDPPWEPQVLRNMAIAVVVGVLLVAALIWSKGRRLPPPEPPPLPRGRSSSAPPSKDRIRFSCPECFTRMKVPAAAAGRRTSCPQCGTRVEVPE